MNVARWLPVSAVLAGAGYLACVPICSGARREAEVKAVERDTSPFLFGVGGTPSCSTYSPHLLVFTAPPAAPGGGRKRKSRL